MNIAVMLCVNNYLNGSSTGKVRAISIGKDDLLELEGPLDGDRITFDKALHRFKIGRGWFGYSRYSYWVGNWCWDCVWMEPGEVARLLNFLRQRKGWWQCASGPTMLFERWKSGEDFTAEILGGE